MSKKSGGGKVPKGAPRGQVTSEEALAFIRKMQRKFSETPRTRAEKARLQNYLARFTEGRLKAVGTRVQSDLLLRPPKTIRRKDFKKPRSG